jgi:hypothetical protein
LNGCCSPGELADSVNFRLFFLDHPHHHGLGDTCQWQDTQICVSLKKLIKMVGDVEDHIDLSSTLVSVDTFCKIITNRNRSQLARKIFPFILLSLQRVWRSRQSRPRRKGR